MRSQNAARASRSAPPHRSGQLGAQIGGLGLCGIGALLGGGEGGAQDWLIGCDMAGLCKGVCSKPYRFHV
jgi:predicted lipid-binding transport protein (Tim44 family)